jgi:hypothetical protein
MKDAGARDCLDAVDAGAQAMLVQELGQHHGHGLIQHTASGYAQNRHFRLPLRCQLLLFEDW